MFTCGADRTGVTAILSSRTFQAAARLYLSLRDVSKAEFEAVAQRLSRSGDIICEIAREAGGRYGDRPDLAQGGGTDPSKTEQALDKSSSWSDRGVDPPLPWRSPGAALVPRRHPPFARGAPRSDRTDPLTKPVRLRLLSGQMRASFIVSSAKERGAGIIRRGSARGGMKMGKMRRGANPRQARSYTPVERGGGQVGQAALGPVEPGGRDHERGATAHP